MTQNRFCSEEEKDAFLAQHPRAEEFNLKKYLQVEEEKVKHPTRRKASGGTRESSIEHSGRYERCSVGIQRLTLEDYWVSYDRTTTGRCNFVFILRLTVE